MGDETGIAWTDHTFNPWIGCNKISPGCKHCYAEELVVRGRMQLPVWGPAATTERHLTADSNWRKPMQWHRAAVKAGVRRRVFCASLADVFEDHPSLVPWRERLFALIEQCHGLDWQLLTKRPENLRRFLPPKWLASPLPHVWLGTTVEDQERANERVPLLMETPAAIRFLSMEPLLEPVSIRRLTTLWHPYPQHVGYEVYPLLGTMAIPDHDRDSGYIHWVILGGESGKHARACDIQWIKSLIDQCGELRTSVFVKQLGTQAVDSERVDILGPDKTVHYVRPIGDPLVAERLASPGYSVSDHVMSRLLKDHKGGDLAEWPLSLQIRQFPLTDYDPKR